MKNETKKDRDKLLKKLCNKVGKTIIDQNLIVEDDHVLVGISGGKDSYILLETLANRKKAFPFKFKLSAVHVEVDNVDYVINKTYMQDICRNLDIPLIHKKIRLKENSNNKSVCFICSWQRRKAIFNLTRELGCNKLAFGHHRDDALQTFLMNMMYHGSISSMPYSLKMFEGRMYLIRPLLDLWEKDLKAYANLNNIEKEEKICSWEDKTKRKYTEDLLLQIEEHYPKAKVNMFHALDNIYEEYLPGVKSFKTDS